MSREKDERGAVAVFLSLTMVLVLGIAALAVDLGMQRVSRRDMQAIADVVALDVARTLNQKTVAQLQNDINPTYTGGALAQSLARNDEYLGEDLTVTAALGYLDGTGAFVPMTVSTDKPTAVKVTAAADVDFAFRGGEGSVSRTAIASTVKAGCFSVGSYAARFRGSDSALISTLVGPMNSIIQPQANIDALTYQGLATATVSLNELVAAGAAGTVDALLTSNITSQKLIEATIVALNRQSPKNTVALTALDKILKGQAALTTPFLLSKVLKVSPTDAAALDVGFNVLDMVAGGILVASGGHAVDLGNGNLSAGIGNLAPVGQARITIIENPRQACGQYGSPEATAKTSQLSANVPMTLQLPSINGITGATGVVQTPEAAVTISINLGNSVATLSADPVCGSGTVADPDKMYVDVQSGVATLKVSVMLKFEAKLSISVPILSLAGVQVGLDIQAVKVNFEQLATAELPMTDTKTTAELLVPPHDTGPLSVGSPTALGNFSIAGTASSFTATVGGVQVADSTRLDLISTALNGITSQLAVNTSVTSPLNSLVNSLNATLTPLRRLLGLNVAGADLMALSRPVCSAPVLRG